MMRLILGIASIVTIFLATTCYADENSIGELKSWKTECVGRYQINLPGEVEVALNSSKHFFDINMDERFRFSDDTIADFSAGYDVYPQMDLKKSLEFIAAFKNRIDRNVAERAKKNKVPTDTKNAYWMSFNYKVNNRDAAWVRPGFYSVFIYRDGHYFNFGNQFKKTDNPANDTEAAVADMTTKINNFRPRALYELPKQPGVCIPYGFIPDDGKEDRNIAVTMRLIEHPEVEIFFQDGATAREPKLAIELFFDGYVNGEKEIDADFWGYRSITMGGQKGKALFVTITRMDDTKDYGYIAYVEGGHDTSSKMLYVIRTASRAKGKPVSKDELKDIAEKIMASVKPHDVK